MISNLFYDVSYHYKFCSLFSVPEIFRDISDYVGLKVFVETLGHVYTTNIHPIQRSVNSSRPYR